MKIIAPNYYKKFKCIADKCQHSCCIGWEIDIDKNAYEKYMNISSDFGDRLKENIDVLDDTAYFKLGENERCPFLNKNNLCDIILTLGENSLCQICNDHPRFRNFYDDRTEIGLGLCCEAAAALIIGQKGTVTLDIIDDDGKKEENSEEENEFFKCRQKLFDILQNRSKSVEERINDVLVVSGAKIPQISISDLADIYLSLERLDDKWTDLLGILKTADISNNITLPSYFELIAEQLLVYFIYRHLSESLWDGRLSHRVAFSILSYQMIKYLCQLHVIKFGGITFDDITEYARMYSSEIEYSEDNIETLLEYLN